MNNFNDVFPLLALSFLLGFGFRIFLIDVLKIKDSSIDK